VRRDEKVERIVDEEEESIKKRVRRGRDVSSAISNRFTHVLTKLSVEEGGKEREGTTSKICKSKSSFPNIKGKNTSTTSWWRGRGVISGNVAIISIWVGGEATCKHSSKSLVVWKRR